MFHATRRRAAASLLATGLALLAGLMPGAALADLFDRILARGEIRIGVAEFTPWTIRQDDRLFGHEIDIGRRLANDMGVEPRFRLVPFGEIIGALQTGEIDIIAAGLAITPSRALEVTFSRPYFRSGIGIATNTAMTEAASSLDDLNDPAYSIAYVSETMAADFAEVLFGQADLRRFDRADAAEAAVLEGEAAVYLASLPEARFLALRNPDRVDLPLPDPLVGSAAGFAVAHGEERLLRFLDAWVVARTYDKWLTATYDFWFRSIEWAERLDGEGEDATGEAPAVEGEGTTE
ncbi:MAG: transporter substrate-binding domain-containing protein [Pseudomonadota bacterium]